MESGGAFFAAASAAALATCAAHTFVGGRFFARPLLASDLRRVVKQTLYYCWHMATLAILVMSGAFAWAAADPAQANAAVIATALAGAFLILNAGQNLLMGNSFARHPQWALFLITAALGAAGLAYAQS